MNLIDLLLTLLLASLSLATGAINYNDSGYISSRIQLLRSFPLVKEALLMRSNQEHMVESMRSEMDKNTLKASKTSLKEPKEVSIMEQKYKTLSLLMTIFCLLESQEEGSNVVELAESVLLLSLNELPRLGEIHSLIDCLKNPTIMFGGIANSDTLKDSLHSQLSDSLPFFLKAIEKQFKSSQVDFLFFLLGSFEALPSLNLFFNSNSCLLKPTFSMVDQYSADISIEELAMKDGKYLNAIIGNPTFLMISIENQHLQSKIEIATEFRPRNFSYRLVGMLCKEEEFPGSNRHFSIARSAESSWLVFNEGIPEEIDEMTLNSMPNNPHFFMYVREDQEAQLMTMAAMDCESEEDVAPEPRGFWGLDKKVEEFIQFGEHLGDCDLSSIGGFSFTGPFIPAPSNVMSSFNYPPETSDNVCFDKVSYDCSENYESFSSSIPISLNYEMPQFEMVDKRAIFESDLPLLSEQKEEAEEAPVNFESFDSHSKLNSPKKLLDSLDQEDQMIDDEIPLIEKEYPDSCMPSVIEMEQRNRIDRFAGRKRVKDFENAGEVESKRKVPLEGILLSQ